MEKTIIIGHVNPDTDSIISALAAQEYFSRVLGQDVQALRAGELNNESRFVLEHFGVAAPELVAQGQAASKIALVDHNEKTQVAKELDYNAVEYIFDHHKLSVATEKPIVVRCEPLGSTSSLIAKMFFEKDILPSENTASILLAGILSDTLNLTSPTTTAEDKVLVEKLNEIAKIELSEFTDKMFKAKSSLEGITTDQIISLDYKTFEMGSKNVGVGTWETTFPESVNEQKTQILQALAEKKAADKLDLIFFMVVDILQQNCQLYLVSEQEEEVAKTVFGKNVEEKIMMLPGVVSRKKQIIPQLTEELSR